MHLSRPPKPAAFAGSRPASPTGTWRGRIALAAVGLLAATVAWLTTDAAASARAVAADPELARLLRGMAVLKLGIAAAAMALLGWRLGQPMRPLVAGGGLISAALLVSGPVLIWRIAPLATGALLFHAGVAMLCWAAWRDRAAIGALLERHRPSR